MFTPATLHVSAKGALVTNIGDADDRALLDVAVAAEVNPVGDPILAATDPAREAGITGPSRLERALIRAQALIDLSAKSGLRDDRDEGFDLSRIQVDDETRSAKELGHDVRALPCVQHSVSRAIPKTLTRAIWKPRPLPCSFSVA